MRGKILKIEYKGIYLLAPRPYLITPAGCLVSYTINVYTSKPTITVYNHPAFTTIMQKDGSWLLAPKNKDYIIESAVLLRNSQILPERK